MDCDASLFKPVYPFDDTHPLNPAVESDHAEIMLKTTEGTISAWNISNPTYHCYFKNGPHTPFLKTHLYIEKPYEDSGVLETSLQKKEDNQVNTLVNRIKSQVSIQIIIEGYNPFIKRLIHSALLEHKELSTYSTNVTDNKKNISSILVDKSKFTIITSGCLSEKAYPEAEDGGKPKDLSIPYVQVKSIETARNIVIMAVHIPGTNSQYPKTGLERLAAQVNAFYEMLEIGTVLILGGDFNAPTERVKESCVARIKFASRLIEAPYLTHINPYSQAANYDHFIVIDNDRSFVAEVLDKEHTAPQTQAFIESIEKNRI